MKTIRFSQLVEKAGRPEVHLLFSKPEADKVLQKAIKARRVITVFQSARGNRTDYGEAGFEAGSARQFLIFPRSLGELGRRKIVGIQYDLLDAGVASKRKPVPKPPRKAAERKPMDERRPSKAIPDHDEPVPSGKVVPFPKPQQGEELEESENLNDLKALVRHAIRELKAGRHAAALNLLKRIVGD